jgi:tetratricopeptide (TPR) repeat protein
MESGSWGRCEKLLETAFKTCDDKESILFAHLLNTSAYLQDKRNRSKEALELYEVSKKIRETHLGPLHEELANTYNNMGLALESCCRFHEALECYQKAVEIDLLKPEKERNKILHIRHLNIGSAYANLERYPEAQSHIEKGRHFAIQTFGKDTYYESM